GRLWFRIVERGPDKDSLFAARLAAILQDPRAYNNPLAAACHEPEHVFRLWNGSESIDVLICFQCDNLLIKRTGGKEIAFADFQPPVEGPLLELAREAFPKDPEII